MRMTLCRYYSWLWPVFLLNFLVIMRDKCCVVTLWRFVSESYFIPPLYEYAIINVPWSISINRFHTHPNLTKSNTYAPLLSFSVIPVLNVSASNFIRINSCLSPLIPSPNFRFRWERSLFHAFFIQSTLITSLRISWVCRNTVKNASICH